MKRTRISYFPVLFLMLFFQLFVMHVVVHADLEQEMSGKEHTSGDIVQTQTNETENSTTEQIISETSKQAESTKASETNKGHLSKKSKQRIAQFHASMQLYQGESRKIDIKKQKGTKVSCKSLNADIVSVTKKGVMRAKSCGKTTVEVLLQQKNRIARTQIQVRVRISNLYHSPDWKQSTKKEKYPVLNMHREAERKKTLKITLDDVEKQAKIKCQTSNSSVVAIEKYKITGAQKPRAIIYLKTKKRGTAKIRITVTQNGNTSLFQETVHVAEPKQKVNLAGDDINCYFAKAAFIGNSVGVGQRMYFKSKGDGFLGNPTMLVRGSYSFANDRGNNAKYKLEYKGKTCTAKEGVAQCGAKRVFINMGINDLWRGAEATYADYVSYIRGIQKRNPGVVIFIESTTPIYYTKQRGNLNNHSVNRLNSYMKKYCSTHKDMYYIDINSILKDARGGLNNSYCSDKYVHMTMKGYEVWTNKLVKEVTKLLIQEQKVRDAVDTARESGLKSDYKVAKKMVNALPKSSVRDTLKKRLSRRKYRT